MTTRKWSSISLTVIIMIVSILIDSLDDPLPISCFSTQHISVNANSDI